MRTLLALALLLAAPSALAQSLSDREAEAAAEAALASADLALADSMAAIMPEVFAAMGEAMGQMIAAMDSAFAGMAPADLEAAMAEALGSAPPEASGAALPAPSPTYDALALYRRPSRPGSQYPAVEARYGTADDGFPAQTTIEGTVVAAGSQRVCRDDSKPVSRWLHIRLRGTTPQAPAYMVVAVECDELASRHYIGRSVRMRAWKSEEGRPVRMARNDVPYTDAPLYVSYPGDVVFR